MIVSQLLILSTLASVGSAVPQARAQQAADSAGTRVVSSRPTDVPDDSWKIGATPEVEIGVESGSEAYQLDRVSSGVLMPDGSVVLANGGSLQLRFYDAAGKHVRSVGGQGQGPGQFTSLLLVGAFAGDSLLAFDTQQRRLTVFDSSGRLGRTMSIPMTLGPVPPTAAGVLRDGRLVGLKREIPILGPSPTTQGIVRPNGSVVVIGETTTTIGTFPDTELSLNQGVSFGVIFGRSLELRGRGDRIAVGNTDAYSIRVYSGAGQLLHVIRQVRDARRFSDAEYQAARPASFPSSPVGARMRGAVEQMPRPAALPAFGDFRIDSQGNLWVQEFALESDPRVTWQIFSGEGRLMGRLSVPATHVLLDANETHALLRVTDALGVQRVRVYRLAR